MSDAARDLLRELLAEALANGNGQPATVPPPPVAAVHRPSTWSQPAVPGEVIGDAAGAATHDLVAVTIASDADLAAFARTVLDRADDIRAGRVRFTLGGGATSPAGATSRAGATSPTGATNPAVVRVARGAVTERTVKKAADAGGRLVLGPRAVLTPLAREKARALGIDIERER